jgi:glycoside/pentoside/hexuronide:cation symporter, GPH family
VRAPSENASINGALCPMNDVPPKATFKSTPAATVAKYAAAVGPVGILGLPFTVYLPPYVASGGVISVALVGLIFSLSTLWDGIIDPWIGSMIDRKSTGPAPHRRWMLIGAVPLLLLAPLIVIYGDELRIWAFLPLLLLLYSSLSIYDVAHLAWGSALTQNPVDSARLFGYREFASKLSLIFAFGAPALAQALIPGLDLQGRILAYSSLVLIALPVALFAIFRLSPRAIVAVPGIGWRQEIRVSLRSRPLVLMMAIQFLNAFAFGALASTYIFYVQGYLRLDHVGATLLFGTFIGGTLGTPVWAMWGERFGKVWMMTIMGLYLVSCLLVGPFVPQQGSVAFAAAFSLMIGAGFMGLMFFHGILADYLPHDVLACGRDRTAFLYAAGNLMQKFGNAAAVSLAYALLGSFGFDATRPELSAELVRNVFIMLPAAGWGVMTILLIWLKHSQSANGVARPREDS